jgi:hypothetical protein
VLGLSDPSTLRTLGKVAAVAFRTGDVAEGIGTYRELLEEQLRVLGSTLPDTVASRETLHRLSE